jgi:hypothetical protein
LLRTLSVAADRWSERVDYQIVVKEKEVYWEHEYGSAAIPVHGKSGTGAAWRHSVGSFCGDRQVEISLSTLIVRNMATLRKTEFFFALKSQEKSRLIMVVA